MTHMSSLFHFFDELSTLLRSGIPIIKALETLARSSSFSRPFTNDIQKILVDLEHGLSFSESPAAKRAFPVLYLNLIASGEKSGRLPDISKKIAQIIKRELTAKNRIIHALLYPALLLHLAILLPPAYLIFSKGASFYLLTVFKSLAVLYFGLMVLYFIYIFITGFKPVTLTFNAIYLKIPVLGRFTKDYTIYRFYLSFYSLYDAGYDLKRAFSNSASFIKNDSIRSALNPVLRRIAADSPLEDALISNRLFPFSDVNLMLTGEKTGTLDESLMKLIALYEEKIELQMSLIEKALPKIIYFIVVFFVAWKIISFWKGYYERIFSLM